jgi:hypothetical protein
MTLADASPFAGNGCTSPFGAIVLAYGAGQAGDHALQSVKPRTRGVNVSQFDKPLGSFHRLSERAGRQPVAKRSSRRIDAIDLSEGEAAHTNIDEAGVDDAHGRRSTGAALG